MVILRLKPICFKQMCSLYSTTIANSTSFTATQFSYASDNKENCILMALEWLLSRKTMGICVIKLYQTSVNSNFTKRMCNALKVILSTSNFAKEYNIRNIAIYIPGSKQLLYQIILEGDRTCLIGMKLQTFTFVL